eukprot:Gb_12147 [translate_table: standard]
MKLEKTYPTVLISGGTKSAMPV